jgi:Uracil phosphoribosyltransferase
MCLLYQQIGTEPVECSHVQGSTFIGCRPKHAATTLIIALMRGGEPMAFGVNDVIKEASFLHAPGKDATEDLTADILRDKNVVIHVDRLVKV